MKHLSLFENNEYQISTETDKKISGYRIYDAEQKRRTVRNDLPSVSSLKLI